MFRKGRRQSTPFIILSLLVHFSVFIVLKFAPAPSQKDQVAVEVEYVTPDELAPDPSAEKIKVKKKVQEQIVEQQKRLNDERDENARFLSAFDQVVQKQTRAERSGKFINTAQGGQPEEGEKDGDKKSKAKDESKPREKGEIADLKDLIPKYSPTPGPKGTKFDESGNPSQTDDYLKDVNTGMQTMLTTREFVYYSYYNRIKEALRQHWEPNVREKVKIIYRKGRSIASTQDRITQVMVTLNKDGELIRVDVITASGIESLDAAAVEAFREAAPFPNPPKGMVEPDGTIKIRWDFVLEA